MIFSFSFFFLLVLLSPDGSPWERSETMVTGSERPIVQGAERRFFPPSRFWPPLRGAMPVKAGLSLVKAANAKRPKDL